MGPDGLLRAVEAEGSRFYEVARATASDRRVPSCPDWTIEDLTAHLGRVQHWVAAVVEAGEPSEGLAFPEMPVDVDVTAWAKEGFDEMIGAFRDKGADAPCWNFGRGAPRVVGWWYRRQALEAAVHRYDMESAAGLQAAAVEPELAAEGVDELLCDMFPLLHGHGATGHLRGTLHLHATDADGEWWVDFDAEKPEALREHKKADTALRGPASGLYLWLWNRQTPTEGGLEVLGPDGIVEAWRTVTI